MKKLERKQLWLLVIGVVAVVVVFATLLLALGGAGAERAGETREEDAFLSREKGYFRILVAGVDRASGLSDVLMLVSLNWDTGEAWVLQIPRDTYAVYTEGSYRKLNGAPNALGGMEQMKQFLSEALGLSIDRTVRLSPDAFCRVVDTLGGVEIELERAMHYEDPAQGLSIHLPKGKQTLDGQAAEQFVRYRAGYAQGDLGRMDAQKVFLAALFRKVSGITSPVTLAQLGMAMLEELETDLTVADATMLAGEVLSLKAENVFLVTAPGEAATAKSGASYYALSRQGMAELLAAHFGGTAEGFDPERVFLNPNNERFGEIYDGYTAYEPFCVSGLSGGESGE
ncbi:MAG: LCP family protein [Clostridia bacterium]|nr:LCP family protein [Clostridia bacterium]